MKHVTRIAAAVALVAVSASASAWYAPYGYAPALTEEQQKAAEAQYKAFADQQAKMYLQAVEAQRKFAEEMAANYPQPAQQPAPFPMQQVVADHQEMAKQIAEDQQRFAKMIAEDQQRFAKQMEADRAMFANPFQAPAPFSEAPVMDSKSFDELRQQADAERAQAVKEMEARRAEQKARFDEIATQMEKERKAAYEQFAAEREKMLNEFPQPLAAPPMDI
jgi:hypothetical protein